MLDVGPVAQLPRLPEVAMDLDDPICQCFGVSLRKVLAFLRVHRPRRASQISECLRAGTGCGCCRPELERLFRQFWEQAGRHETGQAGSP